MPLATLGVLDSIRNPAEPGWLSWGMQPRVGKGKGGWRETKVASKQLHVLCFPGVLVANVMLCVLVRWPSVVLKSTCCGTLFLPLQPQVCFCAGASWELGLWLFCVCGAHLRESVVKNIAIVCLTYGKKLVVYN